MSKKATKAADNIFYKARVEASTFNNRLSSRESASEELGMDRTRMARIELGSIGPYPEEVLMMSDIYNAPELCNAYCSKMCLLGKSTIQSVDLMQLDRLALNILSTLGDTDYIKNTILDIALDGVISSDERPKIEHIVQSLEKISKVSTELKIWVEKNVR